MKKTFVAFVLLLFAAACSNGSHSTMPIAPQSGGVAHTMSGGSGPAIKDNHATYVQVTPPNNLTVTLGTTPTAGDVIVAIVADDGGITLSPQTGWTVADSYKSGSFTINVAWHVAGQENGTYTFNNTSSSSSYYAAYSLYEISGANTTNPIDAVAHGSRPAQSLSFPLPTPASPGTAGMDNVLPIGATVNFGDSTTSKWQNQSGWTQDGYSPTFELQTIHGALASFNSAVNETSTLPSGSGSAYTGLTETVLIDPAFQVTLDNGCKVYPINDHVFNSRIDELAEDSTATSNELGSHGTSTFAGSEGSWFINSASSPTYPEVDETGGSFNGITQNVPFSSSMNWQAKSLIGQASDHHLYVVNSSTCLDTESYNSFIQTSTTLAYHLDSGNTHLVSETSQPDYGEQYDLATTYPSPAPAYGVNDAHTPAVAGLIKHADIAAHCICHPLNLDIPKAWFSTKYVYPSPAGYVGQTGSVDMGVHLRLKSSYVPPGNATSDFLMIVNALKRYGAYVSDAEGSQTQPILYIEDYYNGSSWTPSIDSTTLSQLGNLTVSDFDIVAPPGCTTVAACEK